MRAAPKFLVTVATGVELSGTETHDGAERNAEHPTGLPVRFTEMSPPRMPTLICEGVTVNAHEFEFCFSVELMTNRPPTETLNVAVRGVWPAFGVMLMGTEMLELIMTPDVGPRKVTQLESTLMVHGQPLE